MKTNFFQNIAAINAPGIWNIVIQTDDKGGFTVSTRFSAIAAGDAAAKYIKPLTSNGTAEDFDNCYFESIEAPVQQTAGLLTNIEDYLKGLAKAREQSKMVQDSKTKSPKVKTDPVAGDAELPEAVNSVDKRKAYTDLLRQIVDLESRCMYEEALALLPDVAGYPEKEAELKKRRADLERKRDQKKQLLFND